MAQTDLKARLAHSPLSIQWHLAGQMDPRVLTARRDPPRPKAPTVQLRRSRQLHHLVLMDQTAPMAPTP